MKKKCFKCGEIKDINLFYTHKQMIDGHLGKCIECAKKDSRGIYRPEYEVERNKRPERKIKRAEYVRRMRAKNPEKTRARRLVSQALKSGKLIKQPCEKCGVKDVQAHHEDYSKPLDVVWLCFKHHRERDLEIINKINV